MNKRITKLYSCCLNNEVILFETNLEAFCTILKNIEPKIKAYRWFIKKFKEDNIIVVQIDGKEYTIQSLV